MSDQALLIGQVSAEADSAKPLDPAAVEALQAQGRTAIAVPQEDKQVSLFAIFKGEGEEYVEKKATIRAPKTATNEDLALYFWRSRVLPQGVLMIEGSAGEVNLYPLDLFKTFRFTVGVVVGVSV